MKRFEVEPEVIGSIKNDDAGLLKFGFEWIKFGIFGKKVIWINEKSAV